MTNFVERQFDLPPTEVARRMDEEDLILIDVREDYEWRAGHASGAHHVEIERVASAAPSIPRDRPVAFICLGGTRSAMVAAAFRAAGYNAYNVAGGFGEWFALGLPTEPDDASVAPH